MELDLKGLRCPKPIVEISKAIRKIESNEKITIYADDKAFEPDINAWCKRTKNILEEIILEGDIFKAVVVKK